MLTNSSNKVFHPMKRLYCILIVSLIFAGLILGIGGCSREKHEGLNEIFGVTKPWRQKVEMTKQYVAQIRAIQHIEVRAFEKGYLQEIFVDEGQLVKKGD